MRSKVRQKHEFLNSKLRWEWNLYKLSSFHNIIIIIIIIDIFVKNCKEIGLLSFLAYLAHSNILVSFV